MCLIILLLVQIIHAFIVHYFKPLTAKFTKTNFIYWKLLWRYWIVKQIILNWYNVYVICFLCRFYFMLEYLYNQYIQWKFLNIKCEVLGQKLKLNEHILRIFQAFVIPWIYLCIEKNWSNFLNFYKGNALLFRYHKTTFLNIAIVAF